MINLKRDLISPSSTIQSDMMESTLSPTTNTNTSMIEASKAEEQLNELLKEKERIDNDTTIDKKRKQNLKKKLRKKLKKVADKINNESILDTENNDNDLDNDNLLESLNADVTLNNDNKKEYQENIPK